MNLKRWFAWLCLALMLVAEIFLFHANREKDAALTSLRTTQHDLRQAQTELDELKNSNAGLQAGENSQLRKQNEILTAKLAAMQTAQAQLQAENQRVANSLGTARTALELQQQHLAQLQEEKQRAAAAILNQNICINNLRQIDAAKVQWMLEKNKTSADVPTVQDLLPYFKDSVFPVCPDGGSYDINAVGERPTCNIAGHVLPQ